MKVWAVVKSNYTGTFMAIEKIFQNESDAIEYSDDKNRDEDWNAEYYYETSEHNLE